MNYFFEPTREFAKQQDKTDVLHAFRHEFVIDEKTIYLDGNSLGRLPKKTAEAIENATNKQWGQNLIESWNKHWYFMPQELGNQIAQIIGASADEVLVCDNTTTNLYKLVFAALKYQTTKNRVVSDIFNFPSDLYILQGIKNQLRQKTEIVLAQSKDGILIDTDDLKSKIDKNTALVILSFVSFKSSYLYNAEEITQYAQQKGALVLWDLSHATGVVPINLNQINADLAVGCTYKFLNSGPGAPAFLYIRKSLQQYFESPVWGWFGHQNPFEFNLKYKAADGIQKFLSGTPPILSLMAIETGVEMILRAGMQNIRNKSIKQSEYLIFLLNAKLKKYRFSLGSPQNFNERGSHVSLIHQEAYRICQALISPHNSTIKIIPDFREPNIIRIGIAPLYTTFDEIWQTVERIIEIIVNGEYKQFSTTRNAVT